MKKILVLVLSLITLFTCVFFATACGESEQKEPCSSHLILETNPKGTGYRVMGITCNCSIVEIPETYNELPVVEIGTQAFKGNDTIKEIIIPSTVTKILQSAFENCTILEKVTFKGNSTLKQVGKIAFKDCVNLKEIALPSTVSTLQYGAFMGCASLTQIVLPSSLKSISQFAFSDNTSLTKVTLPKSLKDIQYYAFNECVNLTTIIYPSSLKDWENVNLLDLWNNKVPAASVICQEIVDIA